MALIENNDVEPEIDIEDETVEDVEVEETEQPTEDEEPKETETDTTSDEETKGESTNVETKPKQTADERKKYAEMRRQREAREREEIERKARQEGIVEGLGGINPYTNQEIKDDIDFKLYQEQKACEAKGYDPNNATDLLKFRKEQMLAEKESALKKDEETVRVQEDIKTFSQKYPDLNVKEILANDSFIEFANDLIGQVPLHAIYAKYDYINKQAELKAKDIALKKEARRQSDAGSHASDGVVNDLYTAEELDNLSREEIEANWDKVQKSKKNYFK